jgi:hypothetical protein
MPNKKDKNHLKDIAEEVDTFDTMLSALVELLEEKGILTQQEWENRIKEKIEKTQDLTSYRDIQFYDETIKLKEGKASTKPTYPDITVLEDRTRLVPVYPPLNFKLQEKERKERITNQPERTRQKKKSIPEPMSYHAWDWLNITREEMEARIKQSGENKCIICGRDTSHSRSKILCQWHVAAFTKWRGKD